MLVSKKFNSNLQLFLLCVIVFTLPFSFWTGITSAVFRISIAILLLTWFFDGDFKTKSIKLSRNPLALIFIGYFLIHVFGLLYTEDIDQGIKEIEKKIPLLIFPLVLSSSTKINQAYIKTIFISFITSIGIASLICLINGFIQNSRYNQSDNFNWFYISYNDLTSIINIQPNYLAAFTSLVIVYLVIFLFESSEQKMTLRRIGLMILSIYLFGFLMLLSARTVLGATFLAIIVVVVVYGKQKVSKLNSLLVIGVLALVTIISISVLPILRERMFQAIGIEQDAKWINQFGDATGVIEEPRYIKWKSSWNAIKDNWVVGTGTGGAQNALREQYKLINWQEGLLVDYNSHNQYLQTWLTLGLPGILILLASVFIPMKRALKNGNIQYSIFLFLILIYFLTESFLERQWGVVFYSFFNSLLAFYEPK